MPMHPSFNNIIKFVTLLSPFMLTSYLVLESFFRQDLKGLIFLAGAVLASFFGLISRLMFKISKPQDAHPGCNIFEFTILELNAYSAPAFNTLFLCFSLVYLCANMWISGNWNIGVFATLIVLCISNIFVRLNMKCVGSQDIVLGAVFGLILGGLYYALIYSTRPEWTYFSESSSDRQVCRRIGTTKFKCTIRKA
tara:strand:- start:4494 stop:5078 length:585 start_codon:yes stop_codon:yes gene_type:complete